MLLAAAASRSSSISFCSRDSPDALGCASEVGNDRQLGATLRGSFGCGVGAMDDHLAFDVDRSIPGGLWPAVDGTAGFDARMPGECHRANAIIVLHMAYRPKARRLSRLFNAVIVGSLVHTMVIATSLLAFFATASATRGDVIAAALVALGTLVLGQRIYVSRLRRDGWPQYGVVNTLAQLLRSLY